MAVVAASTTSSFLFPALDASALKLSVPLSDGRDRHSMLQGAGRELPTTATRFFAPHAEAMKLPLKLRWKKSEPTGDALLDLLAEGLRVPLLMPPKPVTLLQVKSC